MTSPSLEEIYQQFKEEMKGADGKDGIDGTNGIDGKDGINGRDGIDGKDGAPGGGTVDAVALFGAIGLIPFDLKFGTFANLANWMDDFGPTAKRDEVKFSTKDYNWDTQLPMQSGHSLVARFGPSREFGTGPVFKLAGNLPSFFKWVQNDPAFYPNSGAPRDISLQGMQFNSGGSQSVFPVYDISKYDGSKALWCMQLRDCGFIGARLFVGWADNLHVTGFFHVQGITDTWLDAGGSECSIDGSGISLMDSSNSTWMNAGKPFLTTRFDMFTLSNIMISAREKSYHVQIAGGGNQRFIAVYFDAPGGAYTKLPQIKVVDGKTASFTACSFHNGSDSFSLESGSAKVTVNDCIFNDNKGVLAKCGPNFNGVLEWSDSNTYSGTQQKIIQVARLSQVDCKDEEVQIQVV